MALGDSAIWAISRFGMNFERTRLEAAALNIANANAAIDPAKPHGFRPVSVVANTQATFGQLLLTTPPSVRTVMDEQGLKHIHQPEHPLADKNGMVTYPNINTVTEMVNVMSASRAYEANVKVLNAAMDMGAAAREIGKL